MALKVAQIWTLVLYYLCPLRGEADEQHHFIFYKGKDIEKKKEKERKKKGKKNQRKRKQEKKNNSEQPRWRRPAARRGRERGIAAKREGGTTTVSHREQPRAAVDAAKSISYSKLPKPIFHVAFNPKLKNSF